MLDPSGKSTPRGRASVLREKLADGLQDLERWINRAPAPTIVNACAPTLSLWPTNTFVRAIDALELASQE